MYKEQIGCSYMLPDTEEPVEIIRLDRDAPNALTLMLEAKHKAIDLHKDAHVWEWSERVQVI